MKKTSKKEPPPCPFVVLFNKPFHVLCQFTDKEGRVTLSDYIPVKDVYAAGRLDYDSEGLVILTNDGSLQHKISDPCHKLPKTYLVQVEGMPNEDSLVKLRKGVLLKDGMTMPAEAEVIDEPRDIWPRVPPIRYRKNIPATWLRLTIIEGRNRQVRRMVAAVGHPCLRLIRVKIGQWELGGLKPGEWKECKAHSSS
ncbi:MAG TPA: pseudouridine synthase [Thermodesulfobacteriota bacterium]|nr:pseudouridine synthase [Thermodesulfobacteriota bacterium]